MTARCTLAQRSINSTTRKPLTEHLLCFRHAGERETKSMKTRALPGEAHPTGGETKTPMGLLIPALTLASGDPASQDASACAWKPLSSVVCNHSSFSASPGSLCKRAHVLWQAEGAVGCLTSHLLLLFIWGGAG